MNHFARLWISLSWCHAAALMAIAFLAIFSLTFWLAWYFDPLRVEMRAIQRKRRKERKLIAQTRAMLLKRHDSAADRDCFRDAKELTR